MPTLFAVYNLIDKEKADEYDQYLINTKVPGIRGAPWCTAFNIWKILGVFLQVFIICQRWFIAIYLSTREVGQKI